VLSHRSIPSEDNAVQPRKAYTLMEVVLVCAIIAIVACIAFPTVMSMYSTYRLQAASDAVRSAWVRARSHATDEGRRYRFSVVPGKGNFRIAPDSPEFWSGSNPEQDPDNPAYILEDALPSGIRFSLEKNGQAVSGEDDGESSFDIGEVDPGKWVGTAYFEADGSAQEDVEITFTHEGSRPMILSLRAMTGIASVKYGPVEGQR
jgi:prepilin-type N-terminal cleavage/methylation domain-containing protein